jgi:hypothetical protein
MLARLPALHLNDAIIRHNQSQAWQSVGSCIETLPFAMHEGLQKPAPAHYLNLKHSHARPANDAPSRRPMAPSQTS